MPNPEKQTVHTSFPGVLPHSENKLYEPHVKQMEKQRHLGWKISISGIERLRSKTPEDIAITVVDAEQMPIRSAAVTLSFLRMANSQDDHKLILKESEPGRYTSQVTIPDAGRWLSEIHIARKSADGSVDTHVERQSLFIEH